MAQITIPYPHEGDLMIQARTDLAAFAPIYERYVARIYYYCLRRLRSPEEAEDVTSIIFTRALQHIGSYRGGSVQAWLFRIAHNELMNFFRSRRRKTAFIARLFLQTRDLQTDHPIEALIQSESQQQINRLILNLPDEQQELLALKIDGGLSAREIGAILGKSEGAVRVALHRIIEHIRMELGGDDDA
jgi:RNA polymerase sigma-70 factor (ECF subfamily)